MAALRIYGRWKIDNFIPSYVRYRSRTYIFNSGETDFDARTYRLRFWNIKRFSSILERKKREWDMLRSIFKPRLTLLRYMAASNHLSNLLQPYRAFLQSLTSNNVSLIQPNCIWDNFVFALQISNYSSVLRFIWFQTEVPLPEKHHKANWSIDLTLNSSIFSSIMPLHSVGQFEKSS